MAGIRMAHRWLARSQPMVGTFGRVVAVVQPLGMGLLLAMALLVGVAITLMPLIPLALGRQVADPFGWLAMLAPAQVMTLQWPIPLLKFLT